MIGWRLALLAAAAAIAVPAAASAQARLCTPGAKLDAKWENRWYTATVKQGPDAQGRCFIGYDGYGKNWDEWAEPARLRPVGGVAAPAPNTGMAAGALADGRYVCQIWMGSMLATLGRVDIKGRTYRGPSNAPSGGFTPFVLAGGRMDWRPNFSQLASTGAVITGTRVAANGRGFNVDYKTGRGYNESMECRPE